MGNVVVIGGGPAGIMAAAVSSQNGNRVTLLEKNDRLGRKLAITGKGRCNVTNACDPEELIKNTVGNPYFLYSAFYGFGSDSVMELFERLGVPLKVERGNRVFPVSDKASDIIRGLTKLLAQNNVKVMLKAEVKEIITENRAVKGVVTSDGVVYKCDKVIVATGGLSYPGTGSTGDGYKFARAAGHTVTKLYPSLVPLVCREEWVGRLEGLSLKNIAISVTVNERDKDKVVYSDFGEMIFTANGVSGPVVLSASGHMRNRYSKNPVVAIDLKPALTEAQLDARILRDFEECKNKDFKNALDELLPQKLIPVVVELSGIAEDKKVNSITKEERAGLVRLLKRLTVTVTDCAGFGEAVITGGGVCVDEVEPGTMQSKVVSGLYFCGEVLDVDALTGGFNLQIAFSTGYLAGKG